MQGLGSDYDIVRLRFQLRLLFGPVDLGDHYLVALVRGRNTTANSKSFPVRKARCTRA